MRALKFNDDRKQRTIDWLMSNQVNGAFDEPVGMMEKHLPFPQLPDEEIEWYYYNWCYDEIREGERRDHVAPKEFNKSLELLTRKLLIRKQENNEFVGTPEQSINFETLDSNEISWYLDQLELEPSK